MIKNIALLMLILATSALAQQPTPPAEQALANKLMGEINASLQCQAALITATKELEELRKKASNVPPPPVPPPH